MIKKYLLRTLAALALAFVIIISTSSHAQAAAPNSLAVFTGFQPYGGTVTPAVGVGGTATVVGKRTSNGLTIPLSGYPYYGNHLDTDNNGSPNTNSTLWGTDGNFYGYSFQSRKYLIWCGNSGGVPDGEMQVDVTLAFQNSQSGGYASATELNVGGVIKTGHWAGEWWRQGEDGETWVGFSTYFNGQNARIVALNPGLMVVKFTFIEDAPSYSGTIQTNKRLASNSAVLSTASAPGNSKIELKSPYVSAPIFDTNSTSNPWSRSNVYVTWNNQFANTPGRYYKNIITLPSGWRINRVQTSLPGNVSLANDGLTCTEANQSGICTVSGLTVYNGSVTYVDWFIEAIPSPPPVTPNYPWLQTTNGNVVANGKITGNAASDTNPGARLATTPSAKEVEFLIISKVGNGGPFCSNKNYILANPLATAGDCGNGLGYSALNVDSVAGTEDKVVAGVKAAYNDLPAGCKTDTALVSGIPTSVDLAACPNGRIVKYTGTNLGSYSLTKGRVTILVEGDLDIGQNIGYGGTMGYSDPRDVPNLAIVVKGNVKILAATPQVDASIYATGTISTCDTAPAKFCGYQLTINGFLSAQSGFIFGRAYILGYNGQAVPPHAPAEIVNLTLQSVLYPPPGIDYGSVFKGDSSVKIDSSEYQPRF
ncbi:MAG: hypothetical protein WCK71_02300 [bacterium]